MTKIFHTVFKRKILASGWLMKKKEKSRALSNMSERTRENQPQIQKLPVSKSLQHQRILLMSL